MADLNVPGFLERTIKFAEVEAIDFVITKLGQGSTALDQLITNAPTEAADIVSAVDGAAKQYFGAFVGAEVSAVLAVAEPPLQEFIVQLGDTVQGYVPKVVAALQQIAAKLLAEANAA
jgi:hypothetical protein